MRQTTKARDRIDALLTDAGWIVQHKNKINLNAGLGVAIREYQTNVGPADYVLFVYESTGVLTRYLYSGHVHLSATQICQGGSRCWIILMPF